MNKEKSSPAQWDKGQERILLKLFKEERPFEEIAERLNKYIKRKYSDRVWFHFRSPVAVATKLYMNGLIPREKFEEYKKSVKNELRAYRDKNYHDFTKKVLKRDGNKCVICGTSSYCECCHIIPFRDTKANVEIEGVMLCPDHHKDFDRYKENVVKGVFQRMRSLYQDYHNRYELISCMHEYEYWSIKAK